MVHGLYGLWCMDHMVHGLWFTVYGLWFMVYGLWIMVYGAVMFHDSWLKPFGVEKFGCWGLRFGVEP